MTDLAEPGITRVPLYLVRWPGLSASLVSARGEDDLLDTLDQVADSEGATRSVYRGPAWIDFDVPATYRIDEKAPGEPLRGEEDPLGLEVVRCIERDLWD